MEFLGLLCPLILVALVSITIYDRLKQGQRKRALEAQGTSPLAYCERCGSRLSGNTCLLCGPFEARATSQRRALQALVGHLDALRQAGQIAPEIGDRVLASIQVELANLPADAPPELSPLAEFTAERVRARAAEQASQPATRRPSPPPRMPAADCNVSAPKAPVPSATSAAPAAAVSPFAQAAASLTGAASRATAPEFEPAGDTLPPLPQEREPAAPRARFADLLSAFMEEKNVRWGELVGGLLIVGCSIALVISFWSQIAERDLLRFGLFNGIVTALFGLGYYTSRKWKLPTTSRGVLLIATLLVPLNFLSVSAVTQQSESTSPQVIAGEALSVALFSTLVYLTGRLLVSGASAALVCGVLGPSIMQLFVRRFVTPETTGPPLYALAGAALACHAGAVGWLLRRFRKLAELSEADVNALFRMLGMTAFAAAAPCGLLLALTGSPAFALERLAPLVALAGSPALLGGLFLWWRLAATSFTGLRTAGTSISLIGMGVMLSGLALAWPEPALLVAVAVLVFAVLSTAAWAYELPAAHVPAAAALAIGYLFALHVARGDLAWTCTSQNAALRAILSAVSGNALVVPAVIYGALAALLNARQRPAVAAWFGAIAGGLAVASLALVTALGFRVVDDPYGTTYVYAIFASGALAGALVVARRTSVLPQAAAVLPQVLAWAGAVLAALASVQGLVYWPNATSGLAIGWTAAALAHATLLLVIAIGLRFASRRVACWFPLISAFESAALASSSIALVFLIFATLGWTGQPPSAHIGAAHAALLMVLWLAAGALRGSQPIWAAGQAAGYLAATYLAVDIASRQTWYAETPTPALDPRMIQWCSGLAAGLSLIWLATRLVVSRGGAIARSAHARQLAHLMRPPLPAVDHVATGVLIAVLLALASYAALPGAMQELALKRGVAGLAQRAPDLVTQVSAYRLVPHADLFELNHVPHLPAAAAGTWLLLALIATLLVAGLWERANSWRLLGLLTAGATLMPLVAAGWEPQVAVASALRWSAAIYFLVGSLAIWSRTQLAALASRVRIAINDDTAEDVDTHPELYAAMAAFTPARSVSLVVATLVFLCVAPLAAMGTHVALAAIDQSPLDHGLVDWIGKLAMAFGAALVFAAGLVIADRTRRTQTPDSVDLRNAAPTSLAWASPVAALVLVLGAAPLVAVSIYMIATALAGNPIVGPDATAIFRQMGAALDFSLPIVLITLVLVGYAIRQRSAGFAFVAGLAANTSATIAYSFTVGAGLATRDPGLWIELTQLNALVASIFGLAWYTATAQPWRRFFKSSAVAALDPAPAPVDQPAAAPVHWLQMVQAAAGLVPYLASLFVATISLFWNPLPPETWLPLAAGSLSAVTLVAVLVLACFALARADIRIGIAVAAIGLWAVASFASLLAVRWDQYNALAMHTLLATRGAAPWLLVAGAWAYFRRGSLARIDPLQLIDPRRRAVTLWTTLSLLPALAVALRPIFLNDPQEPWWSTAGTYNAALVAVAIALWSCRRFYLYAAAGLLLLATSIGFPRTAMWQALAPDDRSIAFIHVNLIALSLPVAAWLAIELRRIRPAWQAISSDWGLGVHRIATWAALAILTFFTAVALDGDYFGDPLPTSTLLGHAALISIALATVALAWDSRAREAGFVLYLFGLVAIGQVIDPLDLVGDRLIWTGSVLLGAFTLATCYLWSRRGGVALVARRLRIPLPEHFTATADDPRITGDFSSPSWFVPVTLLVVAIEVALVYWVELVCPEATLRASAAQAAVVQAFALGMLARGCHPLLSNTVKSAASETTLPSSPATATVLSAALQQVALLVGMLGLVAIGWSWVEPGRPFGVLARSVATCVALVATNIVYGLLFAKLPWRAGDWPHAARQFMPAAVVALLTTVVVVLGQEVWFFFKMESVPLAWPGILAIALALGALFAASLAAALLPGRDPLNLSERGRMAYVYAGEAVLALLFLHIRVTMPWLFRGYFLAYWPLVVMAIAYLGVGLAEWYGRRGQRVLAEPLERTGVLLPLLPVVGFWFVGSETNYSLLLLVVGGLYMALAVTRRSFGFGLLSALAANGGLWHYLHQLDGLGLLDHPQLWLIPPALCVLAAAYLNRQRLSESQMTMVRYLTSMTIYISSTADIFLNGVAEAPWLPLVLGALSLVGIFAGILMRVRAFLFLGTSFLVLAITTVIWHAAVNLDQTWIWYASGIVVGVAIIVLFAVFEKRRQDVIQLVETLKTWEA